MGRYNRVKRNNNKVENKSPEIIDEIEKKIEYTGEKVSEAYKTVVDKKEEFVEGEKVIEVIDKLKYTGKSIGEKATETYKKVADRSLEIIENTKTRIKIANKQYYIIELYTELGQKIFERYANGDELLEYEVDCQKIKEVKDEIKEMQNEISKKSITCKECKIEIVENAVYCPNCGTKIELLL